MSETKLSNGAIAGINLGIFAFYAIIAFITKATPVYAILVVCHFFISIILSIALKGWMWLLTGFVILIIGVSTCVNMPWQG